MAGHRATYLARFGGGEEKEGRAVEGVAIIQVPTFEEAKAWCECPAYQEASQHRSGVVTAASSSSRPAPPSPHWTARCAPRSAEDPDEMAEETDIERSGPIHGPVELPARRGRQGSLALPESGHREMQVVHARVPFTLKVEIPSTCVNGADL